MKRGQRHQRKRLFLTVAERNHAGNKGLLELLSGKSPRTYDRLEVVRIISERGRHTVMEVSVNIRSGDAKVLVHDGTFRPGQILHVQSITGNRGD